MAQDAKSRLDVEERAKFLQFQDALLKAGPNGGADAAHRLLTEIKQYVQANFDGAGSWSVMVQIYTNLEGLGRKLAAIGTISNPAEIHGFCRAFGLNQPLFSIIDVGPGKERFVLFRDSVTWKDAKDEFDRADHKLKGVDNCLLSHPPMSADVHQNSSVCLFLTSSVNTLFSEELTTTVTYLILILISATLQSGSLCLSRWLPSPPLKS